MSELVIQLTEEELNRQVNLTRNCLSLDFDNDSFKKGPTFSLGMREQALEYCQKNMTKKLKSLIVEGQYSLTIWIQEQINPSQNKVRDNESEINQTTTKLTSTPVSEKKQFQGVTTKKVIRHYRGQTYEVEVPIPQEQISTEENKTAPTVSTKKIIKHYRGQIYEVEVPDYSAIQQKLQNKEKPRRKYRGQDID